MDAYTSKSGYVYPEVEQIHLFEVFLVFLNITPLNAFTGLLRRSARGMMAVRVNSFSSLPS